jgi:four helix bundle protein
MQTDSSGFKQLALWQKAQDFASEVAKLVARLPNERVANAVANQLLRSAGSIPANIAEGYGRFYRGAYRNHLSIARGSAFESESWLDLLAREGYVSTEVEGKLTRQCMEIARLLTLRMKSLEQQGNSLREEVAEYEA